MKQRTLSVSAIVLLHEEASFLDETLSSVKNQSHKPLEIILVDSSVQGYGTRSAQQHPGIRYYHQPSYNRAASMNFGIHLAQGDLLGFLDTGDYWTHHKLADQINYLETHPEVAIVQGLIQNVSGTVQDSSYTHPSGRAYGFVHSGSLMYRRSVFEQVGVFDESLNTNEEVDWFLRAWDKGMIKIRIDRITLLHQPQKSQPFATLLNSVQAQLQFKIEEYIHKRQAKVGHSTKTPQEVADFCFYMGNPYREIIVDFQPFTIISDDCWGFGPYSDFNTEFCSPFMGIRIEAPCYLELLKDLRGYLKSPLVFTNTSKYEGINSLREVNQWFFPIARLRDQVELLFAHESDEDVCREKWERRVKRINWNNLFIKFREDASIFKEEYFAEFAQLEYDYKICFTGKEYPEFDCTIPAIDYFKSMEERNHMYPASKKYFDPIAWIQKSYGSNPRAYRVQQTDISLTETDRLTFFQTLHTWFSQVIQVIDPIDRFFSIADDTIRLRFTSKEMADQMTRAIAHLETTPTEHPALTICFWDHASTQHQLPGLIPDFMQKFHWYEYLDAHDYLKPLCSDRFRMHFKLSANIFSALDFQQNLGLYWTGNGSQTRLDERGFPLQTILRWWVSKRQQQMISAAAVGTEMGGVLLVGKGQSGKSTATLTCLNSPLTCAGDQYCVVAAEPIPYVHSLYNSVRMKAIEDLKPFPDLLPLISDGLLVGEKPLIFLHQHFPKKVASGFPLRAIFILQTTGKRDTQLVQSTAIAALKALVPSTLFQLSGTGKGSFQMMSTLVKQVPCYILELGTDITQIPLVILEFLNTSKSSLNSLSPIQPEQPTLQ